MPPQFGQNALAADEFQLTTDERARVGLTDPHHPAALPASKIGKIGKARISWALGELAGMNIDNAHEWLRQVAQDSPAKAFELFLELVKFSAPQLKAVAVDVRSGDGTVRTFSTSELEKLVSEQ